MGPPPDGRGRDGRRDGRGDGYRGRAASASERAYRALTLAYPEESRRRYGEEMVHYFGDLCREESRSRGLKGLAALWARTLPELVFTALKERSTMLTRSSYLPALPRTAVGWGALSAVLGGVLGTVYTLLTFYGMTVFVFPMDWWYGTRPVSDLFSLLSFFAATLLSSIGLFALCAALAARPGRPGRLLASAGAALAALATASWLTLGGYEAVRVLGSGSAGYTYFRWEIWPSGTLAAAGVLGWVVGLLLLGAAAVGAGLPGRLRVLPLAAATLWPASLVLAAVLSRVGYLHDDPNGFAALQALTASLPFLGMALLGRTVLRDQVSYPLAAPG